MARINWLNFLLWIVHANITLAQNPQDSNDELFADAESALGSEYVQFVEQSKQHKPVYFSDNYNVLDSINLESILNPETEISTNSNQWEDFDEKMITNWDELFADAESAFGSGYMQFVEQSKQHKPVYFSHNYNVLDSINLESILNPETEISTNSNQWEDFDEKMITNWDELFADVESALGSEYAQFIGQLKQHKPVYFSDNCNVLDSTNSESILNPETETAYPVFICGFLGCKKKMNSEEEYLEHFKMHEKRGY